MFDPLLIELVAGTAAELERYAKEHTLAYVNERDHLQPRCLVVAESIAGGWTPRAQLKPSYRLKMPDWPRLGPIDITVLFADETRAALELKCATGPEALTPCAWDALKLAFALREGVVSEAYLLAATTASDWEHGRRGTELFDPTVTDVLNLRDGFLDWWRHWEKEGYRPASTVPRRFTTRPVYRASFDVGDSPWELRLAEVRLDGDEQLDWASTLV